MIRFETENADSQDSSLLFVTDIEHPHFDIYFQASTVDFTNDVIWKFLESAEIQGKLKNKLVISTLSKYIFGNHLMIIFK